MDFGLQPVDLAAKLASLDVSKDVARRKPLNLEALDTDLPDIRSPRVNQSQVLSPRSRNLGALYQS